MEYEIVDSNITYYLTLTSPVVSDMYWLGIAFGATMDNTDIVLCSVEHGEFYCLDGFTTEAFVMTVDEHNDIDILLDQCELVEGQHLKFAFTKKLVPDDRLRNAKVQLDRDVMLQSAHGKIDLERASGKVLKYVQHDIRDKKRVTFRYTTDAIGAIVSSVMLVLSLIS